MPTNSKNQSQEKTQRKKLLPKFIKKTNLPSIIKLTKQTNNLIWANRKLFLSLALLFVVITILIVGVISSETYLNVQSSLESSITTQGTIGEVARASLLSLVSFGGGLSSASDELSAMYSIFIILILWLTTIWILRNLLARHKFKLRDSLYNCGAPIIPTFLVGTIAMLELLPAVIAKIIYSAAQNGGVMDQLGFVIGVYAISLALVGLSVYLLIGTLFGLITATLPSMYPIKALKIGSKIVSGQRVAIIWRLLWANILTSVVWLALLTPLILLDNWLNSISNIWLSIPFIPIVAIVLSVATTIWIISYIYMLYRGVVDENGSTSKN